MARSKIRVNTLPVSSHAWPLPLEHAGAGQEHVGLHPGRRRQGGREVRDVPASQEPRESAGAAYRHGAALTTHRAAPWPTAGPPPHLPSPLASNRSSPTRGENRNRPATQASMPTLRPRHKLIAATRNLQRWVPSYRPSSPAPAARRASPSSPASAPGHGAPLTPTLLRLEPSPSCLSWPRSRHRVEMVERRGSCRPHQCLGVCLKNRKPRRGRALCDGPGGEKPPSPGLATISFAHDFGTLDRPAHRGIPTTTTPNRPGLWLHRVSTWRG